MNNEKSKHHWVFEFVVEKNAENKMHRINDEGEIVDKNGVPIKDHRGNVIVVPLEYRYHYRHYLEDN